MFNSRTMTLIGAGFVLFMPLWITAYLGYAQLSHYSDLNEVRTGILCERGLSLLASNDPADVARGDTIVREESCTLSLDEQGRVPVSRSKLDAFLAQNPNGLVELMALKQAGANYVGPVSADPALWFMAWIVALFVSLLAAHQWLPRTGPDDWRFINRPKPRRA